MSVWTDDRVEELKRLWDAGASASAIARALGAGITRNAVSGKVDRLNLTGHPPRVDRRVSAAAPKRRGSANNHGGLAFKVASGTLGLPASARPLPLPVIPPDAPESRNLTLMQLTEKTCKWPVSGEGATTLFCGIGKDVDAGPYCPFHTALARGKSLPEWTPERRAHYMRSRYGTARSGDA